MLTAVAIGVGKRTLALIQEIGRMMLFLIGTFAWMARPPFRLR